MGPFTLLDKSMEQLLNVMILFHIISIFSDVMAKVAAVPALK